MIRIGEYRRATKELYVGPPTDHENTNRHRAVQPQLCLRCTPPNEMAEYDTSKYATIGISSCQQSMPPQRASVLVMCHFFVAYYRYGLANLYLAIFRRSKLPAEAA